ncbi:hypothetical protein TVAG_231610 [Trichomonas vaginalis G3]|uniref:DUF3447 domain-containing protein n=1 Tax=Trichomonas vaginalis (strain ATCC PRA-98 / G3) TaxID=412133 RepID=A2G357_TRIV3|nr:protein of unknown function (DUF3447) [Trichomonas vaginalis G3]EAX88415.1 hypothetical protein TVAG_231610 [Trichomonas vaginalis G3]KAI5504647.1 protein of unknown function (DUF3447) [Trichomonas vaginalis G3]|eukprot:XP_001301345.1 hypothetical protein [Trichomonas vaginalis G3]
MSDQVMNSNEYSKLRSIYKYYIDSYITLYQLKTNNEEEIENIYQMIKTELIDSKGYPPQCIIKDILNIIPYNNRCTKSYLKLAKLVSDDYDVKEVTMIPMISNFLFYKEYGIQLDMCDDFEELVHQDLDIHSDNTIYRTIMDDNIERFIAFTEREEFDKDQLLANDFYPLYYIGYSLLELCCYHGAVDCFKLLRSKFNSEITGTCLQFSFLGRNKEILNECLKYKTPNTECMKYAIISHNIDFVTFLMNEYNIKIDLYESAFYNNLDSFLVYFDQTNNVDKCFRYSVIFNIPITLRIFSFTWCKYQCKK